MVGTSAEGEVGDLDVRALKANIITELGALAALSDKQFADNFMTFKKYVGKETEEIQKIIGNNLCSDASILDIGSGMGDSIPPNHSVSSYLAFEENKYLAKVTYQNIKTFWNAKVEQKQFTENTELPDRPIDLALLAHSLYGNKSKIMAIQNIIKKMALKGKLLIFIRSCSASKVLVELEKNKICFSASTFKNHISFPSREDFGAVISLLVGMDLTLSHDYLQRLYDSLKDRCNDYISVPTTCIIVYHPTFIDLETAGLLLPGDEEYKSYLQILKNKDARQYLPIAIVKPQTKEEIQKVVQWAYKNNVPLSVVGGGHSGHCSNSNALLISMANFKDIKVNPILNTITFETGVTSGEITEKAWEKEFKLAVPLGARPSVGCGMVLQGGIGHFSRLCGLSTSNVFAASVVLMDELGTLVEVDENSTEQDKQDLLWMVKGAGSNTGVVVSITMRVSPINSVSLTAMEMKDVNNAQEVLDCYGEYAPKLPNNQSLDLFLYKREGINLALNGYATSQGDTPNGTTFPNIDQLANGAKMETTVLIVPKFSNEPYTIEGDSFKRCAFVSKEAISKITPILLKWLDKSPSSLSYFHIVHCGGKALRCDNSSFGVHDWEFAIVVTGLWTGSEKEDVKKWVYEVMFNLEPYIQGVYSVDLGPHEQNDIVLVRHAFGPNLSKINSLKQKLDPKNLLNGGCPIVDGFKLLQEEGIKFRPAFPIPNRPKWVIIVCGKRCSGKDYFASVLKAHLKLSFKVEIASISEDMKRVYALETGADFNKLCNDWEYKEEHRTKLIKFYDEQKAADPNYNQKQLLNVIEKYGSSKDIIVITGMREEEVFSNAQLTHCATISVFVKTSDHKRAERGWKESTNDKHFTETALDDATGWDFTFENDDDGEENALLMAKQITAEISKAPQYKNEVEKLKSQVLSTINFPSKGIIFRDILPTTLGNPVAFRSIINVMAEKLQDSNIDVIVAVESAGFLFGPSLSEQMKRPLIIIRKKGKLPSPYYSVGYKGSHVAALSSQRQNETHSLSLSLNSLLPGQRVALVDDVLATGDTIIAGAKLIHMAHAVLVKAICATEFTSHNGKQRLAKYGIDVDCLLSFWGK